MTRTYLELQEEIEVTQKRLEDLHAEEMAAIKKLINLKNELMDYPQKNEPVKLGEGSNG